MGTGGTCCYGDVSTPVRGEHLNNLHFSQVGADPSHSPVK